MATACSRSSRLTVGQNAVEDVVQGRGGALALLSYAAGWTPTSRPTCSGDALSTCADWLAAAGGALALANLLHVAVYTWVFGTSEAAG